MEEIITYKYRANDGTMFDDDSECLRYELEQTIKKTRMVIKDAYGETFDLIDDGVDDALNNAEYVTLESEEDLAAYNTLCEYYGYQKIDSVGHWYYDHDKDEWMRYEDLSERFNEITSIFSL